MVNEKDEKYSGQEESEYHFADDEVSYEVEQEDIADSPSPAPKKSALPTMSRGRRMAVSVIVFLGLVFAVYKMVMPASEQAPGETITPAPVASTPQVREAPVQTTQQMPEQPAPVQQPVQQMPQQPAQPVQQQPVQQMPQQPVQAMPQQPVQPVVQQPVQQVPQQPVQPVQQQPVQTLPPVTGQPMPTDSQTVAAQAELAQNAQQLVSQLQSDYIQRMGEFAAQNKQIEDQARELSARVGALETQINQLVTVLTQQNAAKQPAQSAPQSHQAEMKIPYSIQAIIPGRAWLRSDNGDTVTVTEGDMVPGVGRVTKIDPYNGIVEINTGSTVVSISYGNGG